ncbi:hypothetical protein T484DRAFT_2952085 [Baffinella frigidus]|nr:hypothetical protein T484DRAFT_2952085 [Cryptophyta sp. CCMP2293]
MERFRDQSQAMCNLAATLLFLDRKGEATTHYEKARALGAAHGFFTVECSACQGLGLTAVKEGRLEEGVELLRSALAAVPLCEDKNPARELAVLSTLINALFKMDAFDELETLVPRYREAAQEQSRSSGRLDVMELDSLLFRARLHEARGKPQDAAAEVRALLDLMRENQEAVHAMLSACQVLRDATTHLKVLDPELGEEELIKSVEAELANLVRMEGEA